jgi:DNA ligase-1
MNRFAALLDNLVYEPRRNAKIQLLIDYFASTPDPDRGFALAAMTGALTFKYAKPSVIRTLISERTDPVLFALSYDFVGDLSETVALLWPEPADMDRVEPLRLGEVVDSLSHASKMNVTETLSSLLDRLDDKGRWALLKLVTGGLRIGVSARLVKTALGAIAGQNVEVIEELWHSLTPPYDSLFAWLEGRGEKPAIRDPVSFRPVMLAQSLDRGMAASLNPQDFVGEWKWDGIRVQLVGATLADGHPVVRLYSRSGDDISAAFPDLIAATVGLDGVIDGELLIVQDGIIQSFNVLQQRLNRKTVTPKLLDEFPALVRAYDCLVSGPDDLRTRPWVERRSVLELLVQSLSTSKVDVSPIFPITDWDQVDALRSSPELSVPSDMAEAIEGCMVKRRDSVYVAGRPTGPWFKWKRDPFVLDAVLMYAQRGHGKRSSFYSDYTFGLWREDKEGLALVPVGKAYFGFTDEELRQIDQFVRNYTVNRFGPVREVAHKADEGLVFEVAFEGVAQSGRHKIGFAMRFPRISRIRWDKRPREADSLVALAHLATAGRRKI